MKFALNLSALWLVASNSVAQAQQTIAEIVVAGEDFSTLETVVLAVDGAAEILQNDEATVFAPNNAAFAAMDQDFLTKLLTAPFSYHLQDVILFHVVPGVTVLAADIADGSQMPTLANDDIILNKAMDGTVTVNSGSATVITADVEASNGVIHVIDQVLLPFWANLSGHAFVSFSSDFSTLVSLIDSAGLADTLNGPGPFTIFAPTNAAFDAALLANPSIDITDIPAVTAIVQRHVVADVITGNEIEAGAVPTDLAGEALRFISDPEGALTVNDVSISSGPFFANNGIVYLLDSVILPIPFVPTITDIVVNGDDFFTLETALTSVGIAGFLRTNELTVFVPNNAAFAAIDQDFLTKLLTAPFKGHLTDILGLHIIEGTVMAADITNGPAETAFGETIDIAKSMDGNVTINGLSTVIQADVEAYNGIIHVIDQVLLPDWVSQTAYSFAGSMPAASTLIILMFTAMIAETLKGPGPFTVFAPTNAAFVAAIMANPDIDTTDMALVSIVLQTHVVADVIYFYDIEDGMEVTSLSGQTLTFNVMADDSVTVNGVLIDDASSDNLVNNGLVHTIDGLIIPDLSATAAPVASTTAPAATTTAPVASTTAPAATTTAPVAAPTVAPTSSAFDLGTLVAASSAMASCVATMLL